MSSAPCVVGRARQPVMPVFDVQDLTKAFGDRTLLDGVNVTIGVGERVGVVGDNGAGKSTLARIVAGLAEADTGQIHRQRGSRVAYLAQEPELEPGQDPVSAALSGLDAWNAAKAHYDAICQKMAEPTHASRMDQLLVEQENATAAIERLGGWNRPDDAVRILRLLGISDQAQDVATMSGGERRRVALARLLVAEPDLAVLDEPTNHLDADTIEWLEGFLADSFPGAILLITHDRWLLDRVVTRTLEVEAGNVHAYEGGWGAYLEGREERRTHEQRTEENRQNFLRKEIEWLRRQPKARTGKQKARIGRAEAAIAAAPAKRPEELELSVAEDRLGGTILEARHLSVGVAGRTLLEDVDFRLNKGSRVGIVGRSGVGKTTLLRTLLGELPPVAGEVVQGKNTKIAYLDQLRGDLDADDTVYDAVTGGRPSVKVGDLELSSYSYLQRFRFRGDAVRQKVGGLSGGERARVALARLLLSTANVLVLDEPTNDLDVMTLGALEDLLLQLKGAALIVSHDRYFLDRVATSILALDGRGGAAHVQGGYSAYADWLAKKKREGQLSESVYPVQSAGRPSEQTPRARQKKLTYGERLELEGLMDKIEKAQAEVSRLEQKLSDPGLYSERHQEVPELERTLATARDNLESLELRWLELEERNDGT